MIKIRSVLVLKRGPRSHSDTFIAKRLFNTNPKDTFFETPEGGFGEYIKSPYRL